MNRRYGWHRDNPADNPRDHHFGLPRRRTPLPPKFNLIDRMPYVQDQRETNACIFYSLAGIIQHLDRADATDDDEWFPSPLFMYWNTRDLEGDVNADDGAQIRNAIKAVAKYGACPNDYWSENNPVAKKPDQRAYDAARKNLIGRYSRVPQSLDGIRGCLAAGHPILFGFDVYEQFESDEMAATGVMQIPKGDKLGGHAVVAVGYDDASRMVLVRNSWGDKWGLPSHPGHFLIPYNAMLYGQASDLWTIQAIGAINEV